MPLHPLTFTVNLFKQKNPRHIQKIPFSLNLKTCGTETQLNYCSRDISLLGQASSACGKTVTTALHSRVLISDEQLNVNLNVITDRFISHHVPEHPRKWNFLHMELLLKIRQVQDITFQLNQTSGS